MNVIAGILIGIVNEDWTARLIVPFGWGISWCIYLWILCPNKVQAHIENTKRHNLPIKWKMSHTQAFYFIEYSTATSTALIFSILSGFIKNIFFQK